METLFLTLCDDIAALKQKVARHNKDIHRKLNDMGQRVDTLEQGNNAREEELEACQRQTLELQDQNADLTYHLEDRENRSCRANICIKEVPLQADSGKLEDYILRLFHHIVLALPDKEIILDHMQTVGCPYGTPGPPQDILTRLHSYQQKEFIMATIPDQGPVTFEGTKVWVYQDLSFITLQRRRALNPATTFLRDKGVKYKWGHSFRLMFAWQRETHAVSTLGKATLILGLEQEGPSSPMPQH
ncbi:hypothetical protein NDU88_003484 [Pleurodeles waltl]|uniref:Uncharacterized protein n=1 Tax=Pleurodeles waltl TaxID=8319 RepID=A0AAV7W4U8_PLEWA|nr:hypothetical protein NDU88_003484 [Pleurodeles waltl]